MVIYGILAIFNREEYAATLHGTNTTHIRIYIPVLLVSKLFRFYIHILHVCAYTRKKKITYNKRRDHILYKLLTRSARSSIERARYTVHCEPARSRYSQTSYTHTHSYVPMCAFYMHNCKLNEISVYEGHTYVLYAVCM